MDDKARSRTASPSRQACLRFASWPPSSDTPSIFVALSQNSCLISARLSKKLQNCLMVVMQKGLSAREPRIRSSTPFSHSKSLSVGHCEASPPENTKEGKLGTLGPRGCKLANAMVQSFTQGTRRHKLAPINLRIMLSTCSISKQGNLRLNYVKEDERYPPTEPTKATHSSRLIMFCNLFSLAHREAIDPKYGHCPC